VDPRRALARFEKAIELERLELASLGGAPPRELDRLHLEEIAASSALAGSRLSLPEIEALVLRGVVLQPQPLETAIAVADYAEAVAFLRRAPLPGGRHPYLRLEEVAGLHAHALRRSRAAEPGTWRAVNVGPFPGGMMPPGPSLVPRQTLALAERLASGPAEGASPLLWTVEAHRRFTRIHPFCRGTGRTGRLLVNLLLRRLGLPPFALAGLAARRYLETLYQAGSPDPAALALILARALLDGLTRLTEAAGGGAALRSLASLRAGAEKDALYKAAQRGRLRVVRRKGALFTTEAWIDEYRASRRSR
jgi:Fic family protein